MTGIEWVSILISSSTLVTVLVFFYSEGKRHQLVVSKFESIDKRFELIDNRFESIDKRFDSMFNELKEIRNEFKEMRHDIFQMQVQLGKLETRVEERTLKVVHVQKTGTEKLEE